MIRVLIVNYEASIQQVYVSDDSAIEVLNYNYTKDDAKAMDDEIKAFVEHETRHLVPIDHMELDIVECIKLNERLEREAEAEKDWEGSK